MTSELETLARLYEELERYADAERCYKRAITLYDRAKDNAEIPFHYSLARAFHSLADLYLNKLQRYDEAEAFYKRALAIYEAAQKGNPQDDSNTVMAAYIVTGLADVYDRQGRLEEAEAHFKRSLAMLEALYGKDSGLLTISLARLGRFYELHQRYAEAERIYRRVLALSEDAWTLQIMARLYISQRRYKEAAALLKRSLAIYETHLGKDDRVTKHVQKKLKAVEACARKPGSCPEGVEDGQRLAYPGMP